MHREIVIDGNNFDDLEGFYCEIENVLTKNLTWKTGHNLNAFNDLLRGGFGVHEYGEPILLRWINFEKSRVCLGFEAIDMIIRTILDNDNSGHDCKLETDSLQYRLDVQLSPKTKY